MSSQKLIKTLLIDDHPVVLNGLKSLFEDEEYIKIIEDADNGLKALAVIENKQIDLVISDISMPEMDGIEFTSQLKAKHPDIKVVLLTAHNEKEILKKGISLWS